MKKADLKRIYEANERFIKGVKKMKIDFEEFLMEKHAEQYIGTKDCMVDDSADWIGNLDVDEFITYANSFTEKLVEKMKKKLSDMGNVITEDSIDDDVKIKRLYEILNK